jgi:DNA-binding transcriptional LysR family regulator
LNLLVVLDELLRVRSTTLAARRLGRTQSAVSHSLRRLRTTLKDPLFVRVGAALRPTPVAEQLAVPLRDVLAGAEALLSGARAFDPARLERTFVVGGTDYAEILLMPRLMPRVRREAPGVTVVTRFLGDDIERALQAGEVDLSYGTRFRPLAGILQQKVADEEMRVILRRGHPALKKRMTPAEYVALDHVLVSPRGLPGGSVDAALEPLGLRRRVVLQLPHFAAAALIVAQTDLVVTLPAGFAHDMARRWGLEAVPVPFPMPGFTFSIAFSPVNRDDPAHAWFRARVIEAGRPA